jgi:Protein of unknown function (DUF2281)
MVVASIEQSLIEKLRELPEEKQREVLDFADFLAAKQPPPPPQKNFRGTLKGLSISEEDIAELRKEMWGNFPREEFFK